MSYSAIDSDSLPCNRSEALLTDIVTQVFQTVCDDGVPVRADAYPFDGEGISRYFLVLSYEESCDWRFVFSIYPDGRMDALDFSVLSCDGVEEPCGELNPDYRTCVSYEDAFIDSCNVNDPTEVQEFSEVVCEIISTLVCEELSYMCSFGSSEPLRNFHRCFEVTSRDIPNLSDRKSQSRARSSNIVARYQSFDKETGEVKYDVTSQSKAGRSYTVTFKLHDWHPDQAHLDDEIQHAVKGNIEIDCTCPAFLYQGYKYIATMKGSSIDPEVRPPNQTNKDRHGFACKHILKAIDSFNQDYDKFRAESRGMLRKHSLKVHHKYEGSVPFGHKSSV